MGYLENEHTFKHENKELNIVYDGEVAWLTFYEDGKCVRKAILNAELSQDKIADALREHGVETTVE